MAAKHAHRESKMAAINSVRSRSSKQRGNMVMYIALFAVAWFVFFTLKSCVLDAKDKRDGHNSQQEDQ